MPEGSKNSPEKKKVHSKRLLAAGLAALISTNAHITEAGGRETATQSSISTESKKRAHTRVDQFSKLLNTTDIMRTGNPTSILNLLSTEIDGEKRLGLQPVLPTFDQDPTLYPSFTREYTGEKNKKGWPSLRIVMRSRSMEGQVAEPTSTNAVRIAKDKLLVPQSFINSISGKEDADAGLKSNITTLQITLKDEHINVPILETLPPVEDVYIQDGMRAVALGRSPYTNQAPNSDTETGSYYLTGYLIRPLDKPVLQNMLREFVKKVVPEDQQAMYEKIIADSYVMVGNKSEWRSFGDRISVKNDGFGQPVYVSTDKGFERMGMLHNFGYLTDTGEKISNFQGKNFIPIYLVYGRNAIEKGLAK